MDEDEDAFLYGGDETPKPTAVANTGEAKDATEAAMANSAVTTMVEGAADGEEDDEDEEEDDDEEEEEEEDSDSDLEIIVDGSAADVRPPPGYNTRPLATFNKSLQGAPKGPAAATAAISTEYTPLTRPGQTAGDGVTASGSVPLERKPLSGQASLTAAQIQALQQQQQGLQSQLPEGPPPPAPITAPRIELEPSHQALMLPPDVAGGEAGPLIYHLDPMQMEEKPWRRPGADMTDWFNYGFNEETWRAWGDKKTSVQAERLAMERDGVQPRDRAAGNGQEASYASNPFQDYANNLNMPPQQMQMMQSMMAASGLVMPPDQLMAFMGMQPGDGGMGFAGPSNPMMGGMMGMGNGMNGIFPMGGGAGMMSQAGPMQNDGQDEGDYDPSQLDTATPQAEATVPAAPTGPMLPSRPMAMGEVPGKRERPRSPLPQNVPTGPKNPGKRYNDRDTGAGAADALDYGGGRDRATSHDASGGGWDDPGRTSTREEREGARRSSRRGEGDEESTSRSDEREEREHENGRHGGHSSSTTSRSTRDRHRSDRRRGEGDDRRSMDRESTPTTSIKGSASRSGRSQGHSTSDRRSGRDHEEDTRYTTSSSSTTRRSRKRTSTEDIDHSPPRESRRRR